MDMTFHKVYAYDHIRHITVVGDTFCNCKDNGPMHNTPMRAHKSVDNKLIFRALGPDRIPYGIACGQQVYARVIDTDNHTVVLEKLCRLGPAKGIITLELNSGDLINVPVGHYNLVLIRTESFVDGEPDYFMERPMFSDMDDNISMQLEVTEQAYRAPRDSKVFLPKDWSPDRFITPLGISTPCFYTDRIPGARLLNHVEGMHTFSTYTKKFTGRLEIWGTLEESPAPYLTSNRWFKISPSSMSSDIEYVNHSGTQAWSFAANFMWLKFRLIPSTEVLDAGTMNKLTVRV